MPFLQGNIPNRVRDKVAKLCWHAGENCLALPKLNLQFLTFHDYLLRNFNLFRLEATYEIREDISDVIGRVGAFRSVVHARTQLACLQSTSLLAYSPPQSFVHPFRSVTLMCSVPCFFARSLAPSSGQIPCSLTHSLTHSLHPNLT